MQPGSMFLNADLGPEHAEKANTRVSRLPVDISLLIPIFVPINTVRCNQNTGTFIPPDRTLNPSLLCASPAAETGLLDHVIEQSRPMAYPFHGRPETCWSTRVKRGISN